MDDTEVEFIAVVAENGERQLARIVATDSEIIEWLERRERRRANLKLGLRFSEEPCSP